MHINPGDHEDIILFWINRVSYLSRGELAARFAAAGHDIRAEEWAVLLLLWQRDGQATSALADATIRDRTTMTRLIDGMVRKGLVVRRADARDRRKVLVALGPHADAIGAELRAIAGGLIGEALRGIPQDDMDASLRVMRRIAENLLRAGGGGKASAEGVTRA